MILVLGKARSRRAPNLGSHLGDLMFHQKNSAGDVMPEQACCLDEAADHQLLIAVASESSEWFPRGHVQA